MISPTDAVLLRIYLDESAKWQGKPLHEAIVLKARDLNLAGATVLRGAMGFGQKHQVHTAKILDLSFNLPLVVEIVESQAKIDEFLPVLDEMVDGALVTLEKVKVVCRRPSES